MSFLVGLDLNDAGRLRLWQPALEPLRFDTERGPSVGHFGFRNAHDFRSDGSFRTMPVAEGELLFRGLNRNDRIDERPPNGAAAGPAASDPGLHRDRISCGVGKRKIFCTRQRAFGERRAERHWPGAESRGTGRHGQDNLS